MRVLTIGSMYPPHHLGGYELTWISAVRHLRASGHEVRVLASDYRAPDPDPAIAEDPDVRRELRWYWRDHAFPRLSLRERVSLEHHNGEVLARHLDEHRPDVVSWWAMGGMSLSLIERVRRLGLPAAGVVGDDWMLYAPKVDAWQRAARRLGPLRPVAGGLTRIPTRVRLGDAARWLFVSETVRRRALEAGWRLPRTAVAHPGIDLDAFPRSPEHRAWEWRLLCLGRIDPRKGIVTALRALEHLPEATLRVIGGGDVAHLHRLRKLARHRDLDGRVTFETVSHAEIPAAYADADAVLFPVLWEEPFGLVPIEAMAVGRPVVATGAGGSGEYLRDGENCVLYQPRDDPAALAAAVRRLADPGLRGRLREGGFDTARQHQERSFNEAVEAELRRAAEGR